jgi:hypothetical protein
VEGVPGGAVDSRKEISLDPPHFFGAAASLTNAVTRIFTAEGFLSWVENLDEHLPVHAPQQPPPPCPQGFRVGIGPNRHPRYGVR